MSEQVTPVAAKTSGMAIASMILGIAGFLTCGVSAVVGLVLGIIALVKISKSRGQLGGNGFAIAGVVTSGVCFLMIPIFAGMLLPALSSAREAARKTKCTLYLKTISGATNNWIEQRGGKDGYCPPSLQALVDQGMISNPRIFICPSTVTDPASSQFPSDYESIFDMATAAGLAAGDSTKGCGLTRKQLAGVPIVWDKKGNHTDGRNVAYLDQTVEFVPEAQFDAQVMKPIQEALEKLKQGRR